MPSAAWERNCNRRELLKAGSCGLGYLALASFADNAAADGYRSPLNPRAPHFEPKAKRIIFLRMRGGPSHMDTFDYKPKLKELAGKTGTQQYVDRLIKGPYLESPYGFAQYGESGLWVSDLYPYLARHADDLCLIHSMHTDSPSHDRGILMMHTGSFSLIRPAFASWIVYGLGTANQELPGFIVLNPIDNNGSARCRSSAFLPAAYQAATLNTARGIADVTSRMAGRQQREHLDLIQAINRDHKAAAQVDSEIDGVIESFELAFRMQTVVPNIMDLATEPESIRKRYGIDEKETNDFGSQCLIARRLAEAGVRFIELTSPPRWDHHEELASGLKVCAKATDKPIAALIQDLKQRGLLSDTLVVWGGEFGRTAFRETKGGRNHNHLGFTMWLAGGGVKGGFRYGATDETGAVAVENKVHVHDLHATMLHLLGLDHKKLTYRYSGRDFRLTDVRGNVVKEIIV